MRNLIVEPNLEKFNKLREEIYKDDDSLIEFLDMYVDNYYDILVKQLSTTELIKKNASYNDNKEKIMLFLMTLFIFNKY